MKWQEEGVILSVRQHGETSAVVSLLTRPHGRHAGIVRVSSRNRSILQPGNSVQAQWSARLPEHLGSFQLELVHSPIARIMTDSLRLTAMTSLLTMLDRLLAERHPYPPVYDMTIALMQKLTEADASWLKDYALFELRLLEILGYGLDLSQCAATGRQDDLAYVSPKSGCAVNREAGLPYASKLFALPKFIISEDEQTADVSDIAQSLKISGYFLAKHFFHSILPDHRTRLSQILNTLY
ncbi:MAG: DNA repair protein RecO [Candidatus Paracaedibacteraceae bacterium]|nr:DNA repair protein RecO [Candidatus Paracaedibacteraceae bacterium]